MQEETEIRPNSALKLNVGTRTVAAKIVRTSKTGEGIEEVDYDALMKALTSAYVDPTAMLTYIMDGGTAQTPFAQYHLEARDAI